MIYFKKWDYDDFVVAISVSIKNSVYKISEINGEIKKFTISSELI